MKIVYNFRILIVLVVCLSCNRERTQLLCKRWQVSDVLFLNEQEALVQSDTMQGNLQERTQLLLHDVMMKNLYEFKKDGSYITGNVSGNSEGEWEWSGKNIRFISTDAEGKKEKLVPVELLTKDSLVVMLKQDQTTLQMKLILTPTKD